MTEPLAPQDARRTVWQRLTLTYRSQGLRVLTIRIALYPLRFTPLRDRLNPRRTAAWGTDRESARRWFARHGRLVLSVRLKGTDTAATAAAAAAIEARPGRRDVVLAHPDAVPGTAWLACMQYAGRWDRDVGIVTPKLISPERRILAAGWSADASGGARMTPRLAGVRADEGRANVPVQVLGAPAAFLYIRNALLRRIGGLDLSLNLDDAVADLCRRCWEAGMQVVYWPAAEVTLGEGVVLTPPADPRPPVRGRDTGGPLPVIYVTEDTGVGGGHRDIFEHLNRLHQRGHQVELWTLADPPNWFPLEVPVRSFPHYGALVRELAPLDAIKVATWWNTAHAVWRASVTHGIPVYFVQDIETSYYPDDAQLRSAVLAWYRQEFAYMTISPWNRDRLAELGLAAELIPPGIDLENFRPGEAPRRSDMLLALGRTNPLKNLPLTLAAWRALPEPRPELVLFGIEPQVVPAGEQGIRYVTAPSDEQVAELLRQATVFVQTSTHEGFCLPPLESMATGGAVVCTDAHGNREFCVDGVNCLMPGPTVESVSLAIKRLLDDPGLRARLGQAGIETAAAYSWPARIDALESFLAALSS